MCFVGVIVKVGYIELGFKFVNWCLDCGLVLVEVEVEYEDKKFDVIDVGFMVVDLKDLSVCLNFNVDVVIDIVIWIIMFWILFVN